MQLFTIHAPCSYSDDTVIAKLVTFTGPHVSFSLYTICKSSKEKKTCPKEQLYKLKEMIGVF